MSKTITGLPNNRNKVFGGAYSVYDKDTCKFKDAIISSFSTQDCYSIEKAEKIKNEYLQTYKNWMFSTHNIIGYEKFNIACFTNGTTESFYNFYLRFLPIKRLRLARGEYYFHQMLKGVYKNYIKFAWIDEEPIKKGDVVLLSIPFSDNGKTPNNLENLLNSCDDLEVPVMLDLAYINIAKNLFINLDHKCIKYVVSSLSKVFPVEHHRIGIRLQKEFVEDQLSVANEPYSNYINLLSAKLGTEMMKKFPADYIFNKYKDLQIQFCNKLNLEPSDCVYFGIDHNNKYNDYNRGGSTNRLCFTRVWDGRMNYEF